MLDPDHAEAYRTRTLIRERLGQSEGLKADFQRYELLTRHLGKNPGWRLRLNWMLVQSPEATGLLDGDSPGTDVPQRLLTADPEDVDLRATLALQHQRYGRPQAALAEYNTILEIDPDHLRARYCRGILLYRSHPGEADVDFSYLLEHPRFEELLRESSEMLQAFYCESALLLHKGATDQALQVACRGLAYATRFNDRQLESRMHYALARAYAIAARSASEQLQQAATHLLMASQYSREYLGPEWFYVDHLFDGQREQILQLMPHPAADFDRADRSSRNATPFEYQPASKYGRHPSASSLGSV